MGQRHGALPRPPAGAARWNAEDPPDAFKERRSQVVYDQFQYDRNPFVGHPGWVDQIFG